MIKRSRNDETEFTRRRPLRGSPHGVNYYIESTSLVFLLFSQVMEWRRGDYIKSIFGQGMGRRRLGLQASSNNLPAGSAGRDLSLHRHTLSTRLENWRRIEYRRRTTNLGLLNARMALMMCSHRRRWSPLPVSSMSNCCWSPWASFPSCGSSTCSC
jgi:hypothetical protein